MHLTEYSKINGINLIKNTLIDYKYIITYKFVASDAVESGISCGGFSPQYLGFVVR